MVRALNLYSSIWSPLCKLQVCVRVVQNVADTNTNETQNKLKLVHRTKQVILANVSIADLFGALQFDAFQYWDGVYLCDTVWTTWADRKLLFAIDISTAKQKTKHYVFPLTHAASQTAIRVYVCVCVLKTVVEIKITRVAWPCGRWKYFRN